jgi:hypothetical protein
MNGRKFFEAQQLQGSVSTAGQWEWWLTGNSTTGDTGAHASPVPTTPDHETGSGGYRNFNLIFSLSDVAAYDTGASDSTTEVAPETFASGETFYQHDAAVMRYTKGGLPPPSLQGAGGLNYQYIHRWDVEEHLSERYEQRGRNYPRESPRRGGSGFRTMGRPT